METKEWVGHADDSTFESAVLKTGKPFPLDFWALSEFIDRNLPGQSEGRGVNACRMAEYCGGDK